MSDHFDMDMDSPQPSPESQPPRMQTIRPDPFEVRPMSRLNTFKDLAKSVPNNDIGLPKFFYRADLIPEDLFMRSIEEQAEIRDAASVEILYTEGFPTFEEGQAVWSQMEYEPEQAYMAFQAYLNQAQMTGIRRIETLRDDSPLGSIDPSYSTKTLAELHCYYFWSARCKAFDLFQQAAYNKQRERRIMTTQDKHFLQAEKLLHHLQTYFSALDEETGTLIWVDELTPKVALDYLEKLTNIQRRALGLPVNGLSPGEQESTPAHGASMETVMRQLAKVSADPNSSRNEGNNLSLDMLLSDPESALLAQRLMIRVSSGVNVPTQNKKAQDISDAELLDEVIGNDSGDVDDE